jgi:hypothetical protein
MSSDEIAPLVAALARHRATSSETAWGRSVSLPCRHSLPPHGPFPYPGSRITLL